MTKSIYTIKYQKFRMLLIQARKNLKLSQVQLSKKLSKPQSFISKYETGERRLDLIEFLELSEKLEIDPLEMIKKLISLNI
ncbi:MAG TPA: helix-turn-helix transcriptional regulator [Candidatus Wallbacteria bacterium]|nr:helix-turn-helix transcriptional regulator [Candidatus Wallbacteria bacterium]